MRTRIFFDPEDFKGRGQMVIRDNSPKLPHGTPNSTLAYKIGYRNSQDGQMVCMISLCDGMVIEYKTIEELCERLNADPIGYRPMNKGEMVEIMQEQGNCFR